MRAVILAGGEGMRMRPLTAFMPKVMLPVGNRPILEYTIKALAKNEIFDITLVVGYHKDKVMQYFGSGKEFGVNIEYVYQRKQLGTAHALSLAKTDEDFVLVYGDNIVDRKAIETVKNTPANTIAGAYSTKYARYGIIKVNGKHVVRIAEGEPKEKTLVFTGMAHFNHEIFEVIDDLKKEGIYDLTDAINKMKVEYVVIKDGWRDATYPLDLLEMNSLTLRKNVRKISGKIERASIIGNVEIGEETIIHAGAYINGNVRIGKNCEIGPNAVITGDTSIGDGVIIESLSHVENSIIMSGSHIGVGSIIRNSVIGRDVQILPRFTVLTGEREKISGEKIVKMDGGAIIGDGANIGAGVVVHPCRSIGANTTVNDLKVITEDVDDNESVR